MGITSASLDEGQVKKLKETSGIVAVEEDVEMHILEVQDYTNRGSGRCIMEPGERIGSGCKHYFYCS